MPKGTPAREYRSKNSEELNSELKKLREELQNIRFSKVSGTAVQKLAKIKVKIISIISLDFKKTNCQSFNCHQTKQKK
jgi:ribosomal protein L29